MEILLQVLFDVFRIESVQRLVLIIDLVQQSVGNVNLACSEDSGVLLSATVLAAIGTTGSMCWGAKAVYTANTDVADENMDSEGRSSERKPGILLARGYGCK